MSELKVYKLPEITKKYGVTDYVLRKSIKSGKLNAQLIGGTYYVTEDSLKAFFEGRN